MRLWFRVVGVLWASVVTALGATVSAQGVTLTVTTGTLQVIFNGADIVGITNVVTGESYLRNASPSSQLDLQLVNPPGASLAPAGSWTVDSNGSSASLTFTDSNRTVTVKVSTDPTGQQVVIGFDGQAKQGGLERLVWGLTGFDMSAGEFVLPASGGLTLNGSSLSAGSYTFYHDQWEAPFLLFQGKLGGVNVYSTDAKSLCKNLLISPNLQQTANAAIQVEAPGPWSTATEAGPIEWRLAAYSGEWQAGARIYRDWHNAAVPAAPLTGARAWVNNIRTVVEYQDATPYQTSTLDSLAAVVNPSQTLLYLVAWRSNRYDVGYPDYNWDPSVPAFIAYAHTLGFRVMLHTDSVGVSLTSPDFASVQQYQVKDPLTLAPQGWNLNLPASTPNRFAFVTPAAAAWRQLFRTRIAPAIQTLQPDAIHLDATVSYNDGNGLISGMNYNQGLAQLEQDLLAAFPGLVLGTEQGFDAISPWASFSQPLYWSTLGSGLSPATTPPAPVSAYALSNVTRYWHLGTTNPDTAGFVPNVSQYEGQAVLPTFRTEIANYAQPDIARFFRVIAAFQKYNLSPAWDTPWNGAVVKYQAAGGVTATLTDTGTIVQLSQQQSGASSVLYTRVHGVNQIDSSLSVPNWPAYNGTVTLGLNPANQYWLDTIPRPAGLTHITALPPGATLGLGIGTLVTPQFAYFQVLPPASQTGFDFFANLWLANAGVTYNGADYPLANGATATLTTMTVGGVSRQAILCQPPWQAQIGGETFVQYSVPIPQSGGQLSFAAGIADFDLGQRQGPMTFKVEINGAIVWQQDVSTGAWQSGSVDTASWAGATVRIRFISNPGPSGDLGFAGGGWSALQLAPPSAGTLSGIGISVPQGLSASNAITTGGTVAVSAGNITVNNLSPGGIILLLTGQPTQTASGQSLLNLPFTLAQGSNSSLAQVGPPAYSGTGTIGPVSSGGVTKPALNAFGPPNGQTILSWLLHLPASPLNFSFSAGFWDHVSPPYAQGYLMSLRVNGVILWQRNVNVPPSWQPGAIDLSPWAGQTVLIELITDTLGNNTDDFTSWGDLVFGGPGTASCLASVPAADLSISVDASGGNQSIPVTVAAGCDWATFSPTDWITVTPSSANGNGAASLTIATNAGPQRQSWVSVAGYIVSVTQAGAAAQSGPEISLVSTIAGGAQVTAPNTWLAIYGVRLSATTRQWQHSDFINGQMPVQLDGVSVSVNGKAAFVEYISPTQVNVLTPLDSSQGTVQITVTSSGVASTPLWIPMQAVAPAFFLFSGSQYVAATHAAGNYLGPLSLYPGTTTPASPGEPITVYAGGFGQTIPPLTNRSASQSGTLPPPLPVFTISGIPAEVQFAGVVAPGLYQFNIVVPPSAPSGDDPIQATYAGAATQSGALISVQH
ncbi:MAG TPA: hypothetical protein VMH80_21865 [Bryobacteraceae bacterium]|nr:hypothetical protein [Bryobacteraceae bacterium]